MRIYLLVDTSGSMEGAKIGALNESMSNLVAELKQISGGTKQIIELSVLSFGKEAKWMYDHPINVDDFDWTNLSAGGMTPMGKACLALDKELLSANDQANDQTLIIILTDGCPTDDYDEGIEALMANSPFKNANKFGIAIGDNADLAALLRFVENKDQIYVQGNVDKLLNTLKDIIGPNKPTAPVTHPINSEDDDEWA